MQMRSGVLATLGTLTTAAMLAQPTIAAAAFPQPTPMRCYSSSATRWSFSNKTKVFKIAKNGRIYGQSGVTLTIRQDTSWTVGGSITGTTGVAASVLFEKASASLSVSVTASRTTTTSYSGSWTVPKTQKMGWLEVGTLNAYKFSWKKYHMVGECTVHVDAHGTAKGPTTRAALAFKHS